MKKMNMEEDVWLDVLVLVVRSNTPLDASQPNRDPNLCIKNRET